MLLIVMHNVNSLGRWDISMLFCRLFVQFKVVCKQYRIIVLTVGLPIMELWLTCNKIKNNLCFQTKIPYCPRLQTHIIIIFICSLYVLSPFSMSSLHSTIVYHNIVSLANFLKNHIIIIHSSAKWSFSMHIIITILAYK